jgi:hypothetical protein
MTPEGFRQIRYLFNPANRARFDLTDYDNDEFMLASEIDAARRRLNIAHKWTTISSRQSAAC